MKKCILLIAISGFLLVSFVHADSFEDYEFLLSGIAATSDYGHDVEEEIFSEAKLKAENKANKRCSPEEAIRISNWEKTRVPFYGVKIKASAYFTCQ